MEWVVKLEAKSGLGSSHRFPNVASAFDHCGEADPIVWSDGYHLKYYLSGSKYCGSAVSKYGFCKAEADGAGFQQVGN